MSDNEKLVNALTISLMDYVNINAATLKSIIESQVQDYYVQYIEETLPSVGGDGQVTTYLMEKFVTGKLAEGISMSTLQLYLESSKQLVNFCRKELNMIASTDIEQFIIYLRVTKHNSDVTIKSKYANLSSIFTYLYNHHLIGDNPMVNIKTPKANPKLKTPLTEQEVAEIKIACNQFDDYRRARDLALISFMLDTGARVSEVSSIKVNSINFAERTVVIVGKGNKQRELLFNVETLVLLKEYFKYRPDILTTVNGFMSIDENAALFTSCRYRDRVFQKASIEAEMREIGKLSGISRLHPHLLRATFATNLAIRGVQVNIIADLLGHANLNTISRYVLMPKSKMKEILRAA